jgi:hypothetical protein
LDFVGAWRGWVCCWTIVETLVFVGMPRTAVRIDLAGSVISSAFATALSLVMMSARALAVLAS